MNQRIIPLLQLSLFIQIIFYLTSFVIPQRNPFPFERTFIIDYRSLVPMLVMGIILLALFIPQFQKRLSKNTILVILFAQAIVTILSRYLVSISPEREMFSTTIGFYRLDMIIFIFIPLIFLAWQYSFKLVIFYCVLITVIDLLPPAILIGDWYIFGLTSLGTIARGLILGIVGWIEYRLVELQRSQQLQLEESNKKLRKYAFTAERLAQSQERNRLARELHDTLAHTLSSVAVQLEATKALFDIKPKESKDLLEKTLENTRSGLKETRRALKDLRALELETYGLSRSITNLLTNGKDRSGYHFTVKISEGMDNLSDEINHALYRIVQETVENIVRHASAKNVSLNLAFHKNEVHLRISDDGVGFNPTDLKQKNKFGIRGIRERVEALGGTARFNSRHGGGTEIEVTLERE